ncbi:MAG: type 1 glutamine amidotransferase [Candidatus Promineifilaceae bacterium]
MMKLGILNACTPQDEIDFDEVEFENFRRFLDSAEHDFQLSEYRITEGDFPAVGECDAYLITGSPKGAYDSDEWIKQTADFIRRTYAAKKKMVGICFGHQILAHSLGGRAEKSPKGWGMGLQPILVDKTPAWMEPSIDTGDFYFCHQDQVTQLPDGASLLAGSEFCPNGIFIMGDQVLGMQLHPEFTDTTMTKTIDYFRDKLDGDFLEKTDATLEKEKPENAIIANWIVNFLANA